MSDPGFMAQPFPAPPGPVESVLFEFRLAATATDEAQEERIRIAMMPRPWDPPACGPELRHWIYVWLADVVGWINEDHTWRTDHVIPICWDLHPHIVHELATVACLRWETSFARTPTALEEWHRFTLPAFLNRIVERVGETGCPPGRHQPSPGFARNVIYQGGDESAKRRRRRAQDEEAVGTGSGRES